MEGWQAPPCTREGGGSGAGARRVSSLCERAGQRRLLTNEGEGSQDLLQVHDLSWDELGNSESDDLDRPADVAENPLHLKTRQPIRFGAETQHDLVAVDRVNVEVDGDPRTAGSGQPVQQRPA